MYNSDSFVLNCKHFRVDSNNLIELNMFGFTPDIFYKTNYQSLSINLYLNITGYLTLITAEKR